MSTARALMGAICYLLLGALPLQLSILNAAAFHILDIYLLIFILPEVKGWKAGGQKSFRHHLLICLN